MDVALNSSQDAVSGALPWLHLAGLLPKLIFSMGHSSTWQMTKLLIPIVAFYLVNSQRFEAQFEVRIVILTEDSKLLRSMQSAPQLSRARLANDACIACENAKRLKRMTTDDFEDEVYTRQRDLVQAFMPRAPAAKAAKTPAAKTKVDNVDKAETNVVEDMANTLEELSDTDSDTTDPEMPMLADSLDGCHFDQTPWYRDANVLATMHLAPVVNELANLMQEFLQMNREHVHIAPLCTTFSSVRRAKTAAEERRD